MSESRLEMAAAVSAEMISPVTPIGNSESIKNGKMASGFIPSGNGVEPSS